MSNVKVVCPKCGAVSVVEYGKKMECKSCIYAKVSP